MKITVVTIKPKQFLLTYPSILLIIIFLGFASNSVYAADNTYLNDLEAESIGNRSVPIMIAQPGGDYLDTLSEEAESTANVPIGTAEDNSYYKDMAKMEDALKDHRPSTYKFYKKLYPKNKARIFELYIADNSDSDSRLTNLQKKVLNLYFNQ